MKKKKKKKNKKNSCGGDLQGSLQNEKENLFQLMNMYLIQSDLVFPIQE